MKKSLSLFIFFSVFTITSCKGDKNIEGLYKLTKGNYRYNTIVIEKIEGNKYSITAFQDTLKKLKTSGELEKNSINMGWASQLIFNKDYNQFIISTEEGSVFEKSAIK